MSINTAEKALLQEFQSRFKPGELNAEQTLDHELIKWIRVKNNNLDKAEEMLRKSLKWRKENGMDNILEWQCPIDMDAWTGTKILGFDKDNYPVIHVDGSCSNYHKIIEAKQEENCIKQTAFHIEKMKSMSKGKFTRQGYPVGGHITIIDVQNLSLQTMMNKAVLNLSLNLYRMGNDNYPDQPVKIYYINAGKVLSTFLPLVKACMSTRTADIMEVYGSPSTWMPVLLEHIPEEVLAPILQQMT